MVISTRDFPGFNQNIPDRFETGQQNALLLEQQGLANQQTQLQQQRQQQIQTLSGQATQVGPQGVQAREQIFQLDPKIGKQFDDRFSTLSVEEQAETQRENEAIGRIALTSLQIPDPLQRSQFLQQERQNAISAGRDTVAVDKLLSTPPQLFKPTAQNFVNTAVQFDQLIKQSQPKIAPSRIVETDQGFAVASEEGIKQIGGRSAASADREQKNQIQRDSATLRKAEIEEKKLDRLLARETNDLRRQELEQKLSEKKREAAQAKRDLSFQADSAVASLDDAIASADRMLAGEGLESAAGVSSTLPTIPGSTASDFEAELDSFQSKVFLNEVEKMRGLGALTEAEGKKLIASVGALTIGQSDKALRAAINRVRTTLVKAKQRMQQKFDLNQANKQPNKVGRFTIEEVTGEAQ